MVGEKRREERRGQRGREEERRGEKRREEERRGERKREERRDFDFTNTFIDVKKQTLSETPQKLQ